MQEEKTRKLSDDYAHIEDHAMKVAAQFWGEELLSWLGVKEEIVRIAPTESIHLEVRQMYEDFNFELKDGSWYHLEFESDSIKRKDLKRFREYEDTTSRVFDVAVITCVICSSKVQKIQSQITEGINTYKVKVIRVKNENANQLFEKLEKKKKITRKDCFSVLFTPLMDGEMSQKERIVKGIRLIQKEDMVLSEEDIKKMQAVLYAFANKFLKNEELNSVKEEIVMTRLGQMIYQDGREEGIQEGRLEGIKALIETYREIKISREEAVEKVSQKMKISLEKVEEYFGEYWKE